VGTSQRTKKLHEPKTDKFYQSQQPSTDFMGTLIHHIITQEILHGRDVVPVKREQLIEGLVALIVKNSQQS
jgi:hypothetical protein